MLLNSKGCVMRDRRERRMKENTIVEAALDEMKEFKEQVPYLKQALELIVGETCPVDVPQFKASGMMSDDFLALQDWASENVPVSWMTGIGVIEAAELLVQSALDNGNIDRSVD